MRAPSKLMLALLGILMWTGGGEDSRLLLRGAPGLCVKHFLAPRYPALARQANIQGTIVATLHIRADGTVEDPTDLQGPALLRDSAAQALRSWTFGGNLGTGTSLIVTIHYSLEGTEDERILSSEVSGDLPDSLKIVSNPFPRRPFPAGWSPQRRW